MDGEPRGTGEAGGGGESGGGVFLDGEAGGAELAGERGLGADEVDFFIPAGAGASGEEGVGDGAGAAAVGTDGVGRAPVGGAGEGSGRGWRERDGVEGVQPDGEDGDGGESACEDQRTGQGPCFDGQA